MESDKTIGSMRPPQKRGRPSNPICHRGRTHSGQSKIIRFDGDARGMENGLCWPTQSRRPAAKGHNASCSIRVGRPTITKDSLASLKSTSTIPFERIGAGLVKEVAKKTDDVAGDGTTTATVLALSAGSRGPA